jgi:hypothetical protein
MCAWTGSSTCALKRGRIFFLICIVGGGIKVHSTLRPPMAYCASPGWLWWWKNRWNDWQGKLKYSKKTCPSAALSTANPTCCPYANPGRYGGKPASNRLSYGTAQGVRKYALFLVSKALIFFNFTHFSNGLTTRNFSNLRTSNKFKYHNFRSFSGASNFSKIFCLMNFSNFFFLIFEVF